MPIPELVALDVTNCLDNQARAIENLQRELRQQGWTLMAVWPLNSATAALVEAWGRYQRSLDPEAWDAAQQRLKEGTPKT